MRCRAARLPSSRRSVVERPTSPAVLGYKRLPWESKLGRRRNTHELGGELRSECRALRPDGVPALRPQRPPAAGALARPVAELRRRPAARDRSARSSAAPSTSASPTSTWPTTTGRPTARPRRTSAGMLAEDFRPYRDELIISTKAGYDMWPGPYGELGLAQVPAGEPRPEPRADGARLRRHLLLAPLRPGHAARGDDGRARTRRSSRARRSTSGISSYSRSAPRRRRGSCASSAPRSLIHQPSYSLLNRWIEQDLLDVLEREGVGVHRLLAAGAGTAHRPVPRRHARGLARGAVGGSLRRRHADRGEPRARAGAERDRQRAAARRWRRWRSPGCCAIRASPRR